MTKNVFNLSQRQILETSKLKEFANNYFKFIINARKFSKGVEKTLGRAISPFPGVFKRLVLQTCKSKGLFGKGLSIVGENRS